MAARIPTQQDFEAFDGAHGPVIWARLAADWRCPSCDRSKFEILRWTRRFPNQLVSPGAKPYMGWLAVVHGHHDHATDTFDNPSPALLPRFPVTEICDQCNTADGTAKRKLGLPSTWSFSPQEIGQFVTATPHSPHVLDFDIAATIYHANVESRAA